GAGAGQEGPVHCEVVMPRRQPIRKARATFLWGLGLFAVLQLGLAVTIERWLPQFRDPYYAYRAARLQRRIAAAPARPVTVMALGSAHIQDGIEAPWIEQALMRSSERPVVVFNFGIPGGGPITNVLTLRRLLAANVRPDLVLVEAAPMFLSGTTDWPSEA